MKKTSTGLNKLIFQVKLPLIALSILTAYLAPNWVRQLGPVMGIFSVLAFLLLWRPKMQVGGAARYSLDDQGRWLLQIMLLQVGVGIVFLGLIAAMKWVQATPPDVKTSTDVIVTGLVHWGLFPWNIIAILAAGFSYLHNVQQRPMTLSCLLGVKQTTYRYDSPLAVTVDVASRLVTVGSLVVTVAFFLFALLRVVLGFCHLPFSVGMHLMVFPVFLITCALLNYPWWQRQLTWLIHRPRSLVGILIFIMGIAFSLFSVMTVVVVGLSHLLPPFALLQQVQVFPIHYPVTAGFYLILWAWFMGFARLLAATIARLSGARCGREVMMATLVLPLCCALTYHLWRVPLQGILDNPIFIPVAMCLFFGFLYYYPPAAGLLLAGEVDNSHRQLLPRAGLLRAVARMSVILLSLYALGLFFPAMLAATAATTAGFCFMIAVVWLIA